MRCCIDVIRSLHYAYKMSTTNQREINMDLAASIRVALAYRGLTQSWLARELGVHRSYINKMTKGHIRPGMRQAERIAGVLGYTTSELIALGEK